MVGGGAHIIVPVLRAVRVLNKDAELLESNYLGKGQSLLQLNS